MCYYTNHSKSQIIDKLKELKQKAIEFEKKVKKKRFIYEEKKDEIDLKVE